jgi:hypothetical protein
MSAHFNNRYIQYIRSDNDLCTPVVQQETLHAILCRMTVIAESLVGEGAKPQVSYDLEHLQVADYAEFPQDPAQRVVIRQMQASETHRTDELAYLALRSMISLNWDDVTSEDDIRRAAAYEKGLEVALTEISGYLAPALAQPEARMPYWGRLGFLRVMTTLPEEQIRAHRLDRVACMLLKDPVFNARSLQYETHGLIGLNFALEPILKGLNRMLLHFHHTQKMAGPRRMQRAWSSLMPVVGYFWLTEPFPANRLTPYLALFDHKMVAQSHALTASQVDFIIRHELGHLVLDHGRRLGAVEGGPEARALRNEFEFAADAFAQGSLRSALYNRLRAELQWNKEPTQAAAADTNILYALHDHQAEATAMRLLFAYMDVIEQLGQLLKRRLGEAAQFRHSTGTHPSPRDRLARLDAFYVSEDPPTSPLVRYAEMFFTDLVAYANGLDDATLANALLGPC